MFANKESIIVALILLLLKNTLNLQPTFMRRINYYFIKYYYYYFNINLYPGIKTVYSNLLIYPKSIFQN